MSSKELTKKQYLELGIPERIKTQEILRTLAEIGCYLGYSITKVRQSIKNYGLPAAPEPNGQWFTTKSLIDRWISEKHVKAISDRNWDKTIQHGPQHGQPVDHSLEAKNDEGKPT